MTKTMPHLKGVGATSVALWKGRLKPPLPNPKNMEILRAFPVGLHQNRFRLRFVRFAIIRVICSHLIKSFFYDRLSTKSIVD